MCKFWIFTPTTFHPLSGRHYEDSNAWRTPVYCEMWFSNCKAPELKRFSRLKV